MEIHLFRNLDKMMYMRAIVILLLAVFVFSCEQENESKVFSSFPVTLVYDTIIVIENEVYNKFGKLYNYDEKFDEFIYSPLWLIDSLSIINSTTGITYKLLKARFMSMPELDTLNIMLSENSFQALPVHLLVQQAVKRPYTDSYSTFSDG
ncbi:MAG: hypothetical protein JW973_13195 [Bacteroidales bacterium]|nr:hypothetical protein [Bacteroidales bacterium]